MASPSPPVTCHETSRGGIAPPHDPVLGACPHPQQNLVLADNQPLPHQYPVNFVYNCPNCIIQLSPPVVALTLNPHPPHQRRVCTLCCTRTFRDMDLDRHGFPAIRSLHKTACKACTIAECKRYPLGINLCTCASVLMNAEHPNAPRCWSCIHSIIMELQAREDFYMYRLSHVRKVPRRAVVRYRARYNARQPWVTTCRCGKQRVAQRRRRNMTGISPTFMREVRFCRSW